MKFLIKIAAWIFLAAGGWVVMANLWSIAVRVWYRNEKTSDAVLSNEHVIFTLVGLGLIGAGWFLFIQGDEHFKEYGSLSIRFFADHKWWIIGAIVFSVFGCFPLMGIPGAGLMWAADLVINPLIARPFNWVAVSGDSVWPMAMCLTIVLPWIYFGSFLLSTRIFHSAATNMQLVMAGMATGGAVLLMQIIYRFANRVDSLSQYLKGHP